jgi:hypothetical protein
MKILLSVFCFSIPLSHLVIASNDKLENIKDEKNIEINKNSKEDFKIYFKKLMSYISFYETYTGKEDHLFLSIKESK